ncbi:VOC family protein [Kribbella sp. NBC_00889]|uniref:VOC family protein n=1 Tax=Kribbella sp. NBC_00889 TaxID=2975974 RepID=UPI00386705AE|nr:VOC family protein [Kribbella sp. NBC_00889]
MAEQKTTTFLMFQDGRAEEAMNFYLSLFDNAEVVSITRYGPEGPGADGSVMHAIFTLAGQQYMCSDSPVQHGFDFTPSISLWVDCADEAEIDRLFAVLSEKGKVMMPLGEYGWSRKFGWVGDRFGISWQLNLA